MYQDWAWDAFVAINSTCRVGSGFSEISDVNAANGGSFDNAQESFLFAEVMKYLYLIHAPVSVLGPMDQLGFENLLTVRQDDVFQVDHSGANQFVFNTEAHPLKVAGPPV